MSSSATVDDLEQKIQTGLAKVSVIGLGYVGLPLAVAAAKAGYTTLGFDLDPQKIVAIDAGKSYIGAVSDEDLKQLTKASMLAASTDFDRLAEMDVIIICVPTPLTKYREPDMSYIEKTCSNIASTLRPGQIIVLESTTYPGTTTKLMKPILEAQGLKSGSDFFIGFSPEREDPGNETYNTTSIPKIVSGDGAEAAKMIHAFYGRVVENVVLVKTPEIAEATKLTENIFRAVNIALVNELKVIYDKMGIDVWDVIEAAKTKPFGYMPFYPGPGLGGHCIPIDPFYLTWISRGHDQQTRFIELAGEINISMPHYVINKLEVALDKRAGISLSRSKILIIGLAYKKNIGDIRESPSIKLIEILKDRDADVAFHDPFVEEMPPTREHDVLTGMRSVELSKETIAAYDAILISTDHDQINFKLLSSASLVIDTRNIMEKNNLSPKNVVKA